MREMLIHGIHDGDLIIHDGIGVIAHTIGYPVLPLKEVHSVVVDAHISDIISYCNHTLTSDNLLDPCCKYRCQFLKESLKTNLPYPDII